MCILWDKMKDTVSEPGAETAVESVHPTLDLSILIPVFNEEANLGPLYESLIRVLGTLDESWEILIVDDGSTDGSLEVMRKLEASDHRVRVLEFVRNFGQTAALAAGFEYARGKILIPLDGDLQNDPADIPRILSKLEEGYDVVSCWRYPRRDSIGRTLLSRGANWMISRSTGVRLHDYGCTLKGYRSDITQHIRLYGEMHRFIPAYASLAGARVTELQVSHNPRTHGESKYGVLRTFKVPLDLMTVIFLARYSTKPMHLFGGLGALSFLGGLLLSGVTLYQKFFEAVKAHRNPLLLLAVFLFLVGVQLILSGLMCELIARTYHESQDKATYILRSKNR